MIAAFRMYEVAPAAARAWRALFGRVFAELGLAIDIVEHRGPAPIAELWARPDLGCAFMCGWPFVRSERAMVPIAAPVPSPPRYAGLARYCSEFLVREADGYATLEDTFGARFGWMAANSQSGFNAPRAFLARFATPARPALYREVVGPLGTPAAALDALREGGVDVVALDGFWLDLCRRHAPGRVAGLRCVATTPWTPIPLLVASPDADRAGIERLRARLISLHEDAAYTPLLAEVLLARFAPPDPASYAVLESQAREAAARGYADIR